MSLGEDPQRSENLAMYPKTLIAYCDFSQYAKLAICRCEFSIGRQRELILWEVGYGLFTGALLSWTAFMTKNRAWLIPIPPAVMWGGYRFEQCYGKNAESIRKKADALLNSREGKSQTQMPGGPITLVELDERRAARKMKGQDQTENLSLI